MHGFLGFLNLLYLYFIHKYIYTGKKKKEKTIHEMAQERGRKIIKWLITDMDGLYKTVCI